MALTLGKSTTASFSYSTGDRVEVLLDFTCDSSYTTGGYTLTPAQLGLTELHFLNAQVQAGPTATCSSFTYDYTNQKLKAIAAGAEITNATNLSTVVGRLVAKGRGFNTIS